MNAAIWSAGARTFAEEVRDYDWDGAIAPVCAEITRVLDSGDAWQQVSAAFWEHYLALPVATAFRGTLGEAGLAKQIRRSAAYTRTRYARPFDGEWQRLARGHVELARATGVPLPALLAALSFAHARALQLIEGATQMPFGRIADVVQRLALVEANIMATHLGQVDAARRIGQRRPVHRDPPCLGTQQPRHRVQHRGLAGTGLANDGGHFARVYLKLNATYRFYLTMDGAVGNG